jgi:DNA repair exonuclease SbcCD nuclease subunit
MKLAIITDTHFGARNDNPIFAKYFRKFYEEVFFPTLEERGIRTVVHMGDVVDRRKFINWKTLYQMREVFFDACYGRYINLHVIIGNHDTFYKNTNLLNSMEGLRLENNNQCHVYTESTEVDLDGTKCLMQPWICPENKEQSLDMIAKTDAQILFGHLEVQGFLMHVGQTNFYEGLPPSTFDKFDMAFSGHFHHKSDNGTVFYLGNPYQITWSDYKDPRGFHIFDTESRELEFILNPHEMFHKIYYDEDKMTLESIQEMDVTVFKDCYIKVIIVKRKNPFWFDTLIDKLYKVDVADISIAENFDLDVLESEEMIDEAEDTITILSKYVNSLELENKKELDSLMKSLYTESLTMETL